MTKTLEENQNQRNNLYIYPKWNCKNQKIKKKKKEKRQLLFSFFLLKKKNYYYKTLSLSKKNRLSYKGWASLSKVK